MVYYNLSDLCSDIFISGTRGKPKWQRTMIRTICDRPPQTITESVKGERLKKSLERNF